MSAGFVPSARASFARLSVTALDPTGSRAGLQRLVLDDDSRAVALTDLVGEVQVGDMLLVNTTAVELGLGSGGEHVVHTNLARPWLGGGESDWQGVDRDAVVMKARYLAQQHAVVVAPVPDAASQLPTGHPAAATGHPAAATGKSALQGVRVALCVLHSHALALVATAHDALAAPNDSHQHLIGYVMSDEAALPYVLSDLAAQVVELGLLGATVSAGQAFGAQIEAVNVASGVQALAELGFTHVVVAPGPGHVGTSTALGFSALGLAGHAAVLTALGAQVALVTRASDDDPRGRHRGISHHSATLAELTPDGVVLPTPDGVVLPSRSAERRVSHEPLDVAGSLERHGLVISTMGCQLAQDALACSYIGAAAAWLAGTTAHDDQSTL